MDAFEIRRKIEGFVENFSFSKTPYQVTLANFVKLFELDMRLNELEEEGVPDSISERKLYYEEIEEIGKEVEEIIQNT